ncbi:MAG: hypothetical protein ACLPY2_09255 [Bryobacteraceae bacterium]
MDAKREPRWAQFHRYAAGDQEVKIGGALTGRQDDLVGVRVLEAAEGTGTAPIKVDSEGTVKAMEPKSRLLAPTYQRIVASRAADNDAGRVSVAAANHAGGGNVGGRTLGGGLGFGLLGSAIAETSRFSRDGIRLL